MATINENYLNLQGSYLFQTVARKVREFEVDNPNARLIKLGIGDVTQPIAPAILKAMHKAVDEMGAANTFHGYAPDLGYEFLRTAIVENEYKKRGISIEPDEIFISDGAKSDCSNIQEIFDQNNLVAVCDPVYPVYVDSNVMAGRAGYFSEEKKIYSKLIYMPCTESNGFIPEFPKINPDLIYLCFPNNPTGVAITKERLQAWVDYALKIGAVILYDAAYEAYINDDTLPHSIFECSGAENCAIEFRSFSKNAGFTGLRLGFTVISKKLKLFDKSVHAMWARRHGTKYNGAPYIIQRAGEAVYSPEGTQQIKEQIATYMKNALFLKTALKDAGYTVYGGENAPYIWLKTPHGLSSWEFFDLLLNKAGIVGTPGSGFGPNGEGFFRLTAFGTYENSVEAIERIKTL
ncbi:MAG: LL-diaminopimelate aminotransferase [Succinivibrionaceae bacterium]|jgi:LL-diaminopimelate aminotransferase|uniref:LL-diaminopimelate aminotransferase n=1 Tax=uncultured Ruminobacter sp. TaxID=538947 RepID=UPI001B299FFD|nr:LL-diaminopimelate aminotransferase [uncultured Ruminobacter sp.]MBO6071187.1 LL-diaminopimelate aminotransferase [Succinivibrionaceae bacterium]MBQ1426271.1 LL-diaminopimelate aminotransferase [Succinivibrionaceae bacterium]MBQ8977927.1 LL-diaminopimelate aminotransferase [Succinivibrionaceae bacterium]